MAKIEIVTRDEATLTVHEKSGTNGSGHGNAPRTDTRAYFPCGDDSAPSLFEVVKYPPSEGTDPHAHEVDEIMYVLEGELIIGNRRYGPGTAVHIPAGTLYGFGFGEQGVRYLNIRPTVDSSYISKAEFLARREARKGATAG